MYSAGTDFKMIITAVRINSPGEKDFKEEWNGHSIASQHFCASYIRNDMLGHYPHSQVCYGFTDMEEDSLIMSGPSNLYSYTWKRLEPFSYHEKFLAPDNQINQTNKHNEMDFRRIQRGRRKQPDYVVVFKRNGIMHNLKYAQKASKDFGGLPIVVIDEDMCRESRKSISFDDLSAIYNEVKPEERKKEGEKLRIIFQKIKSIIKEKDSDDSR